MQSAEKCQSFVWLLVVGVVLDVIMWIFIVFSVFAIISIMKQTFNLIMKLAVKHFLLLSRFIGFAANFAR